MGIEIQNGLMMKSGYGIVGVIKEKDGTYTAHLHIGMTRSEVHGFKTVEDAARRVAISRHNIDPKNPGPLFVTKDGKYYDLNNEEVRIGEGH